MEHPGEDVPPQVVGAEGMLQGGGLEPVQVVPVRGGIVRLRHGDEERQEDQGQGEDQAHPAGGGAEEAL